MTYIRIFEHKKNSRHEYSNRPIGFTVYGICFSNSKSVVKESDYPTKGNNFCIEWIGLLKTTKLYTFMSVCSKWETFCLKKKKKRWDVGSRNIQVYPSLGSNDRRSNRVNPPTTNTLQSSFKKKRKGIFEHWCYLKSKH